MRTNSFVLAGIFFITLALGASGSVSAQTPACHTILPGMAAPAGFGVPWNALSPQKELLMHAYCNKAEARIDLGGGKMAQYIYQKGYDWNGTSWDEKQLTAPRMKVEADWFQGYASMHIVKATAALTGNTNYAVGFICQWDANAWKCGCRDSSCSTPHWQLQTYRNTSGYDDELPPEPEEYEQPLPAGDGTGGTATGGSGGSSSLDLSKFIKKYEPKCLSTFSNKITVPDGERVGYSGSPPPNTALDFRGVTVKFAPPGESAWNPSGSNNVCIVGGRWIGQSPRTIGWEESKAKYDGSGIRVAHLNGPFIWENYYSDNAHDGAMLPRSIMPDHAKGMIRGSVFRYTRDDCIESDGNTSVEVDDSYFECNMFFSATGNSSAPRTLNVRNSLIQLKCMPDNRDKRMRCPGFSPRSATAVLWKSIGPNFKIHVKDTIIYQEERSKLSPSSMNLDRYGVVTYDNVIVVWGGAGDWPTGPIPPGVTITKDKSVWERAKAEWMRVHGCTPDASSCTFN